MKRVALLITVALLSMGVGHTTTPVADWAINATAIEACSCPHFCICYFNAHPASSPREWQNRTLLQVQQRVQSQ